MTGTNLQGTNVISMIVPTNHADTYATHDSIYGKGGWREVNTLAERDDIPQERRRRGMVVFVKETNCCYILQNSDYNSGWVPFPSTEDIAEIVNEAIARGDIHIDLTNFYTKEEIDTQFNDYYKSSEVDVLISRSEETTKEWVTNQHYLTEHQSLADYATKAELTSGLGSKADRADLDNFYTKDVSDAKYITEHQDISGKADKDSVYTKEETDIKIENISVSASYYRGEFGSYGDIPRNIDNYKPDFDGNKKPTKNDYIVITDASDYNDGSSKTYEGTWLFRYEGEWDVDNISAWAPEYGIGTEVTIINNMKSDIQHLQASVAEIERILATPPYDIIDE